MLPLWCPKAKWWRSARFSPYIPFKCHLARMRGNIWKVISHVPHMKTLVWWSWHLVMLDGCKVKFEKSSHVHLGGADTWSCLMDARWDLKSHLMWTSCENFGVVEGTLGHARWTWGEIWKVILHAPCMRTLMWWSGHLVRLDGCEVRFEKSSHVHLTWELWCGGADTQSC